MAWDCVRPGLVLSLRLRYTCVCMGLRLQHSAGVQECMCHSQLPVKLEKCCYSQYMFVWCIACV